MFYRAALPRASKNQGAKEDAEANRGATQNRQKESATALNNCCERRDRQVTKLSSNKQHTSLSRHALELFLAHLDAAGQHFEERVHVLACGPV